MSDDGKATAEAVREAIRAHIEATSDATAPIVTDFVVGVAYIRHDDPEEGHWYYSFGSDSTMHALEGLARYTARELTVKCGGDDDE